MAEQLTGTFTPSRLEFARNRLGVTKVALARQSGVPERTLASYERGDHVPPAETVDLLARSLGVHPSFLTADDIEPLPEGAPSFRALSRMSARDATAALSSGTLGIAVAGWLGKRLNLPGNAVPTYERGSDDPVGSAQRLRAEWGLGQAPIKNVVHLIEGRGVRVFSLPERLSDVDAFSFWWKSTAYVVLNTRKSAERGRFDAAHELGHLVMHGDHGHPAGREREAEANRFAAEFLMPTDEILAAGLRGAGVEQVLRAKGRWGVSAKALAYRLHELGITTKWMYSSTCKRLAQMGYSGGEPGGAPRETSQLLEKALAALRERHLGIADIARDLHLLPETLHELMFGLTLTPVPGGEQAVPAPRPRLKLMQGGHTIP